MSFEPVVAAGVLAASLRANGELPRNVVGDVAARAALLVDLTLDGRLPETMMLDVTATDFEPVDRLLMAIEADDTRSLTWWLSHAPVRASDVAEALAARGRWGVRRRSFGRPARYDPADSVYSRTEVTERLTATLRGRPVSAQWTAIACLAAAAGYLPEAADLKQSVITRCEPAAWLVGDLVTELQHKRTTVAGGTAAVRADMGWGTPGAS